jgi:hypothetical protein
MIVGTMKDENLKMMNLHASHTPGNLPQHVAGEGPCDPKLCFTYPNRLRAA